MLITAEGFQQKLRYSKFFTSSKTQDEITQNIYFIVFYYMFKFTTKYLKSKQALNKCNVKYLNDLANYEKRNFIYPSTKHFKSSYKLKSIFEIFVNI